MAFSELSLMEPMTAEQRLLFQSLYNGAKKSGTAGVLLALFLGGLGAHHFYLGRAGFGIIYVLFCWTFVPAILGVVETILMPGRVTRYNERQAIELASRVRMLGQAPSA